jgi:hypothetical protein
MLFGVKGMGSLENDSSEQNGGLVNPVKPNAPTRPAVTRIRIPPTDDQQFLWTLPGGDNSVMVVDGYRLVSEAFFDESIPQIQRVIRINQGGEGNIFLVVSMRRTKEDHERRVLLHSLVDVLEEAGTSATQARTREAAAAVWVALQQVAVARYGANESASKAVAALLEIDQVVPADLADRVIRVRDEANAVARRYRSDAPLPEINSRTSEYQVRQPFHRGTVSAATIYAPVDGVVYTAGFLSWYPATSFDIAESPYQEYIFDRISIDIGAAATGIGERSQKALDDYGLSLCVGVGYRFGDSFAISVGDIMHLGSSGEDDIHHRFYAGVTVNLLSLLDALGPGK